MSRILTVVPAYGRDYKNKAAAIADWEAGKDFYIQAYNLSGYCSNRDVEAFKKEGITGINIRYKKLQNIAIIKL